MPVTPAEFWDRVAPAYAKQSIADVENYQRKLAATQALLQPSMKVLELGCGTGSTALHHAPHVAHILATDVSATMVAIAREKAAEAGIDNVTFEQAGVTELDAPAGSFDRVLALNLLHLLPDRDAVLARVHQLLKPGGLFVSTTPCLADRQWFLRSVIPVLQWLGKAPYVSFLRAEGVRQELRTAGFHECEHWVHGRANSLFLVASKAEPRPPA